MEPEIIDISSDEDNSSGDTEPFPGPGAAGRPRDPRQGREYYRRERQEGPPRQFRHTLFSRRTNIMERLDGMVLLMAVEVTTMFVEAPFARNSPPYAEEPASPPLASHSAQSSEPATPTAAGEMDEEESAPFGTEEHTPPAQDVEAVGEEISPSAGDAESPPTEVQNGIRTNDWEADLPSLDPEPLVGGDSSTEDEEDEPEFRRRFATHRLGGRPGQPVSQDNAAREWGGAEEGPGGKRRRSRHRRRRAARGKRRRSGGHRRPSPEGASSSATKRLRTETEKPEGSQRCVPRSPRERQEGPSQLGKDNRRCKIASRGGHPEPWPIPIAVCQMVVEEHHLSTKDAANSAVSTARAEAPDETFPKESEEEWLDDEDEMPALVPIARAETPDTIARRELEDAWFGQEGKAPSRKGSFTVRQEGRDEVWSEEEDAVVTASSPKLSSPTQDSSPMALKTPTESELWDDIVDLFDGIDGWDTSLDSVLEEEPDTEVDTVARSADVRFTPESHPKKPNTEVEAIAHSADVGVKPEGPVEEPVPDSTPSGWKVFPLGTPLSSGVVDLIAREARIRRFRCRRTRFHVSDGESEYSVTLNAKGDVTVTCPK
ncbi:serine/arginine repetitive matrix protein 3-like [Drosophila montana]|uniref:serine/arginine repetitive matrix protein 3-like n=1 Tax=Drosophila montana TaxID=40370 RepID=UPI00313D0A7A